MLVEQPNKDCTWARTASPGLRLLVIRISPGWGWLWQPLTPRMPLCFESGADPSLPICFGSAHLSKQSATSMPQQLERISAKCTLLREWCGSDPKFWLGSAPLSKQSAKNMLPDPQQIKANWSGSAHLSKQSAIPSNRSQSLNPKP